jgi:putative ABC transport system permease protein
MLLVGASLVVRSVVNLQHVDPGFSTHGAYSFTLRLPRSRYPSPQEREAFASSVLKRVKTLANVSAATVGFGAPPTAGGYMMGQLEGDGITPKDVPGFLAYNNVADDYFNTLQIPIVSGHMFSAGADARREVVVSQGLAKQLWHGESAVGRRMRFGRTDGKTNDWLTVIGVVGDVTFRGLQDDKSEPLLYYSLDRKNWPAEVTIVARARSDADLIGALRPIVPTIDARLTPPAIRTMDAMLAETIANQRFTMTLLATFAALAVALSAIGLYGVLSYVVTQRAREIGIRVALGATPAHVARAIVVRGLALCTLGLVIGLGASVWGTKLIRQSLYGVKPTDPASYLAAAALLLTVCLLACAIPLRRAVGIDPTIAMRGD